MAAGGANIRCELNATFVGKNSKSKSINSCIVRLYVASACLDIRLVYFLYEIFGMAVIKGPLEEGHQWNEWAEIKVWEDWLSKVDDEKARPQ